MKNRNLQINLPFSLHNANRRLCLFAILMIAPSLLFTIPIRDAVPTPAVIVGVLVLMGGTGAILGVIFEFKLAVINIRCPYCGQHSPSERDNSSQKEGLRITCKMHGIVVLRGFIAKPHRQQTCEKCHHYIYSKSPEGPIPCEHCKIDNA